MLALGATPETDEAALARPLLCGWFLTGHEWYRSAPEGWRPLLKATSFQETCYTLPRDVEAAPRPFRALVKPRAPFSLH